MKIAQLVSNLHEINPVSNKAIFSHVGELTNNFIRRGHNIFLFASGDSKTDAGLSCTFPSVGLNDGPKISERAKSYLSQVLISRCYRRASEFDLIHSHFTLSTSFFADLVDTPTVISIHSPVDDEVLPVLNEFKHLNYISFSFAQRRSLPELNWVANIYHGIDTNKFSFNPTPKDYILFLGRVKEYKGTHLAIEAAQKAGIPLVIAGSTYGTDDYWDTKIKKHIDGKNIIFVGEKSFDDKIELLRNAKAVIFPSQCEEVFGYVMIESMSCGTPVIAWNRGSVPEVIKNGITGYIVENVEEAVQAIKSLDNLNRIDSRKRVEKYFSLEKMVSGYEKVFKRIVEESKFKKENVKNKAI